MHGTGKQVHASPRTDEKQSSNGQVDEKDVGCGLKRPVEADVLNREPDMGELVSSFITYEGGYDRNHSIIPHIPFDTHTLSIHLPHQKPTKITMPDLVSTFDLHTVICALQCAGNRRNTMRTKMAEVSGLNWFDGAVMNCAWSGPRLVDILRWCGFSNDNVSELEGGVDRWHVEFACYGLLCQDDDWYGGSIPLSRALDESCEVILATEMNHKPLTPSHGFPLRAIVPGVAGARCVKWLDTISVLPRESANFYQQRDYKILPSHVKTAKDAADWWGRVDSVEGLPVNSVVGVPATGQVVRRDEAGMVEVRGYAVPAADDGPVVRVEVSGDGGASWVEAELLGRAATAAANGRASRLGAVTASLRDVELGKHGDGAAGCAHHDRHDEEGEEGEKEEDPRRLNNLKWAWALWRVDVPMKAGRGLRILSRATDKGGNVQCGQVSWNFRGIGYNGYGEVEDLTVV